MPLKVRFSRIFNCFFLNFVLFLTNLLPLTKTLIYTIYLAIDPDQPTRIVSTDKKAQKAGGLCLALKGVPVKPTDDVDVDKEYQLIPLGGSPDVTPVMPE